MDGGLRHPHVAPENTKGLLRRHLSIMHYVVLLPEKSNKRVSHSVFWVTVWGWDILHGAMVLSIGSM